MKKRLTIIIVSLFGAGCLFFGFKLIYKSKKIENIESIVSDKAIHYLSSYDLSEKINNFIKAPFYKKIVNLPFYEEFIGFKFEGSGEKNFSLLELLDNESALAVFSSQIVFTSKNKSNSGPNIGDFIFFTRLDTKKKIKKLIGDFYLTFEIKKKSDFLKYKGIKVKKINFSKEKNDKIDLILHYAVLGDILLAGNNDKLIKESIDLYKGDNEESLFNSECFHNVTDKYYEIKDKAIIWLYTNQKNFYNKVEANMAKGRQSEKELNSWRGMQINELEGLLKDFSKILIGSFSFIDYDNTKQGIFYKNYNYFEDSRDSEDLLNIFWTSGNMGKNLLEFIPYDSISYLGVVNNFSKSWKYLKKMIPSLGVNLDANQFFGVDINQEILPLLGRNIAGVFLDIKEKSFDLSNNNQKMGGVFSKFPIPFPELAFFIETKDLTAAKKGMNLISHKIIPELKKNLEAKKMKQIALRIRQGSPKLEETGPSVQVKIKNYKGVDINILSLKKDLLDISFCNFDKYIVIAASLETAMKILDVRNSQYNFLNRYSGDEFMKGNLSLPYSYVYIVDFDDMVQKIIETRIFNMAKMYVPMITRGKLSAVDINSIVDVLKDISLIMGTQRLLEGGVIENIKHIKIKGLM